MPEVCQLCFNSFNKYVVRTHCGLGIQRPTSTRIKDLALKVLVTLAGARDGVGGSRTVNLRAARHVPAVHGRQGALCGLPIQKGMG